MGKLRDRFSLLSSLQVDITIIEPVDKMDNVKILTTNNKVIMDMNNEHEHYAQLAHHEYKISLQAELEHADCDLKKVNK